MMMDKVSDIICDTPNRHTFFQLKFFVIGKEPTHQAKLHRCVEELKARKQQVESIYMEIAELKDKNELMSIENVSNDIQKRMIDRRIQHNIKTIDDLENKVKNIEEEMTFFVESFYDLSKIEKMKNWEDLEVQTQYWNAKLSEEISYRMLMQLPIDMEIIKTVLALPDAPIKNQIRALLQKNNERIK
jgi:hypothetical protein